jgi:hypothetical protein
MRQGERNFAVRKLRLSQDHFKRHKVDPDGRDNY